MNKKIKWVFAIAAVAVVSLLLVVRFVDWNGSENELVPFEVVRGEIERTVSTVGTVQPQNRLEIKPPISGRVEKILVVEGQMVKEGEVLALMSSTERATLIDAARLKGPGEYAYWQRAYKETPLISPIDGEVIVRDVEPGQAVTTSSVVLVLSDRLIVEADVDETDIGEIKLGQKAVISLDAYPEISIGAVVDHISYESEVVNNVTIYKVDILPKEIPDVFRSGMSANVEITVERSEDAILIPVEALKREGGKPFVLVQVPGGSSAERRAVAAGMESDGMVEVRSGLEDGDVVLSTKDAYVAPTGKKNGSTPFLPQFKRNEEKQGK